MSPEDEVDERLYQCPGRWEEGPHRWEPYTHGFEFCWFCDALRVTKVTDTDE